MSESLRPLVSVVTPAYNEEAFIAETLASVRNQTYECLEHIVIDDGSTDATPEILAEFEDAYDLRWRSRENRGQTETLNEAFELADGDIVVWLNADDVLFSRRAVARAVRTFERDPDTDVAYGHHAVIDQHNAIDHYHVVPSFDRARLRRWCFAAFVFFRGAVLDDRRLDPGYDYAMDYELFLRLADEGKVFTRVDDVLLGYRRHESTKSVENAAAMREERRRCQREHGQEFDVRFRLGRLVDAGLHRLLQCRGLAPAYRYHGRDDALAFRAAGKPLARRVVGQLRTVL